MAAAARAFIFDMDGTIVDNMAFHTQSWITFFERRGKAIEADEFFRATAGRQGPEIMRTYIGDHLQDEEIRVLNEEKESVYRELYAPHLKAVAGFEDLIADARSQGIALAVGTAAPPRTAPRRRGSGPASASRSRGTAFPSRPPSPCSRRRCGRAAACA